MNRQKSARLGFVLSIFAFLGTTRAQEPAKQLSRHPVYERELMSRGLMPQKEWAEALERGMQFDASLNLAPLPSAAWTQSSGPEAGNPFTFLRVGQRLYTGTFGGLWFSDDNSENWVRATNLLPGRGVTALAANSTAIFAGANFGGTGGGLYRSTDNGQTWTAINNGFPAPRSIQDILANGNNIYVVTFNGELYGSTINGDSWPRLSNGFPSAISTGLCDGLVISLAGADSDWNLPAEHRSINYANLSPGRYLFRVPAINADSVTSEQPATVAFTILPPIYQRWWFILFVTLMTGAAAYAFYRYRVAQILALERMRTRIAHDLHDDIGANLSRIAMLSEVARQRLNGGDDEVADRLVRVATISRESVDALGDIVWATNPHRDKLSDLTQRMRRVADDFCSSLGATFDFHASVTDHNARLDTDMRREVLLIFKECLNNVARHSGCTAVKTTFNQQDGWLVLQIGDNGKGFEPVQMNNGHGLSTMQERARRLGGKLAITSDNGNGTTVRLAVPLSRRKRRFLLWPPSA